MNENTYTADEVANLTGFDDQKLRSQVGNTLRFPKKWIDRKLGIGPVIEVPDWFAQLMTRLGMAVEVQDGSENV